MSHLQVVIMMYSFFLISSSINSIKHVFIFYIVMKIPVNGTLEFSKLYQTLDKNSPLYKEIDAILEGLTENPCMGDLIEFKRIPKSLKKKYPDLKNLLVLRVNLDWRMLYTLKGFPNNKSVYVLIAMPHKEYDKLFGYWLF